MNKLEIKTVFTSAQKRLTQSIFSSPSDMSIQDFPKADPLNATQPSVMPCPSPRTMTQFDPAMRSMTQIAQIGSDTKDLKPTEIRRKLAEVSNQRKLNNLQ